MRLFFFIVRVLALFILVIFFGNGLNHGFRLFLDGFGGFFKETLDFVRACFRELTVTYLDLCYLLVDRQLDTCLFNALENLGGCFLFLKIYLGGQAALVAVFVLFAADNNLIDIVYILNIALDFLRADIFAVVENDDVLLSA